MRIAVLLLFLCALPIHAQTLPDAPKPKPDRRIFIAGVSLLAASKTADAITTRQLLDRGGWEGNPIFGHYPSPQRQAGINATLFVVENSFFYFTERNRHAWIRWAGRAYVGLVIVDHTHLAACNAGINPQSTHIQICHPLLPL